jgi:hypothetical protein
MEILIVVNVISKKYHCKIFIKIIPWMTDLTISKYVVMIKWLAIVITRLIIMKRF